MCVCYAEESIPDETGECKRNEWHACARITHRAHGSKFINTYVQVYGYQLVLIGSTLPLHIAHDFICSSIKRSDFIEIIRQHFQCGCRPVRFALNCPAKFLRCLIFGRGMNSQAVQTNKLLVNQLKRNSRVRIIVATNWRLKVSQLFLM